MQRRCKPLPRSSGVDVQLVLEVRVRASRLERLAGGSARQYRVEAQVEEVARIINILLAKELPRAEAPEMGIGAEV